MPINRILDWGARRVEDAKRIVEPVAREAKRIVEPVAREAKRIVEPVARKAWGAVPEPVRRAVTPVAKKVAPVVKPAAKGVGILGAAKAAAPIAAVAGLGALGHWLFGGQQPQPQPQQQERTPRTYPHDFIGPLRPGDVRLPAPLPIEVYDPTPYPADPIPDIGVDDDRDEQHKQHILGLQQQYEKTKQELEARRNRELEEVREQMVAQQAEVDRIRAVKKDVLEKDIEPLLKPFKENLEKTERQRLHIEENFFANQRSISELETLLTQAQADIRAAEGVTGLAAIRQPRIAQARQDIEARVGIIQAVMAARDRQINKAFNLIDRSVASIEADRKKQLTFYKNIFDFYAAQKGEEREELVQLKRTEKDMVGEQIKALERELSVDRAVVMKIKEAMLNPALANIYERAGVKLMDSLETISKKLEIDAYNQEVIRINNAMVEQGFIFISPEQAKLRDERELRRILDPRGREMIFWKEAEDELTEVKRHFFIDLLREPTPDNPAMTEVEALEVYVPLGISATFIRQAFKAKERDEIPLGLR